MCTDCNHFHQNSLTSRNCVWVRTKDQRNLQIRAIWLESLLESINFPGCHDNAECWAFLTHWISNVLTWNLKIKWGKNTGNKIRLFKGMSLALNKRTKQNDTSFAIMLHLFTLSFQPSFISPLNLNCFKLTTNSSLGHKRFNQSKCRPRPALNALDWMEFISLMLIMSRIIQMFLCWGHLSKWKETPCAYWFWP